MKTKKNKINTDKNKETHYSRFNKIKEYFKKNSFKDIFSNIIHSRNDPHQIALGAAIGLFLSIIPTFGIGMVASLLIAWKRKLNIIATYIGTLIVNPFTTAFFMGMNYYVGCFVLGTEPLKKLPVTDKTVFMAVWELYVGAIIVSLIASILLYEAIYLWISYRRKRKQMKLETY
jgi:uncharacterized protein